MKVGFVESMLFHLVSINFSTKLVCMYIKYNIQYLFIIIDDKLMLATCSQDTYIRLWTIEKWKENLNTEEVQIKKQAFTISDTKWTVTLEAVLSGHENWVYGVNWHLSTLNGNNLD